MLLAFFHPEAQPKISNPAAAGRTFAQRVAYQRAIEEVYWRHRIWPRNGGERSDAKPSLDAVISHAQLEKKVAYYLNKSQAHEDRQRPITAEQLKAEMNRMTKQTKQNGASLKCLPCRSCTKSGHELDIAVVSSAGISNNAEKSRQCGRTLSKRGCAYRKLHNAKKATPAYRKKSPLER